MSTISYLNNAHINLTLANPKLLCKKSYIQVFEFLKVDNVYMDDNLQLIKKILKHRPWTLEIMLYTQKIIQVYASHLTDFNLIKLKKLVLQIGFVR